MVNILKKVYYFYKVGGTGYVLLNIMDKMCHSNHSGNMLYKKLERLQLDQYEEMLKKLYVAVIMLLEKKKFAI